MKKNGFVFVETIVAIVVLTSSLLLLYTSFNKIIQSEKARAYYDDISNIARSTNIKYALNKLNMVPIIHDLINDNSKFFITVGVEYKDLFSNHEEDRAYFNSMLSDFDVSQMVIFKENKVDELRRCTLSCANSSSCSNHDQCNLLFTNLDSDFITYFKSIYVDVQCTYILVVKYNICDVNNNNCKDYYSWVSV